MINLKHTLLLVLVACGSQPPTVTALCGTDAQADAPPADAVAFRPITFIEGQSNAVGQGSTTEVDPMWAEPFPLVRELTRTVRSPDNPPPIVYTDAPLGPRVQRFGAELSLGRDMPDTDIAICAGGAFSLAYQWDPEGSYPLGATENWFHSCITWMHEKEALLGGRVTNILWYQGESDTKTLADAEAYGERLLHAADLLLAEFPCANFHYYRLSTPGTYVTTVRNEQDWAATQDPRLHEFRTDLAPDPCPTFGQHYTSAGYLCLGDKSAAQIASVPPRCN